MKFKHGVDKTDVCDEIWWALGYVDCIYRTYGYGLVVTSLNDGKHSDNSKHYKGEAADIRTRYFSRIDVNYVFNLIKASIDKYGFDTVLERDHIHIEFDPKAGESFSTYIP